MALQLIPRIQLMFFPLNTLALKGSIFWFSASRTKNKFPKSSQTVWYSLPTRKVSSWHTKNREASDYCIHLIKSSQKCERKKWDSKPIKRLANTMTVFGIEDWQLTSYLQSHNLVKSLEFNIDVHQIYCNAWLGSSSKTGKSHQHDNLPHSSESQSQ